MDGMKESARKSAEACDEFIFEQLLEVQKVLDKNRFKVEIGGRGCGKTQSAISYFEESHKSPVVAQNVQKKPWYRQGEKY